MSAVDPQQPPATSYGGGGPSGPRASFGRRVVAYLIDSILTGIVYGIAYVISEPLGVVASIVTGLIYFNYFNGSENGQTVGKMALGIRVIDFPRRRSDRLWPRFHPLARPDCLLHPLLPRLLLGPLGQGEAGLA